MTNDWRMVAAFAVAAGAAVGLVLSGISAGTFGEFAPFDDDADGSFDERDPEREPSTPSRSRVDTSFSHDFQTGPGEHAFDVRENAGTGTIRVEFTGTLGTAQPLTVRVLDPNGTLVLEVVQQPGVPAATGAASDSIDTHFHAGAWRVEYLGQGAMQARVSARN